MNERTFGFWARWLTVASVGMALFGVALTIWDTRVLPGFSEALARSVWGTPTSPPEVELYHRFAHAVLGAVTAGWGVLLTFVTKHAFAARERWAWNAITAAVVLWFVLDSGASAWLAIWPNVALNVASVVPFVVALVATRRAFTDPTGLSAR